MDDLKENVVNQAKKWRGHQKARIAAKDPQAKEQAKKAEYNAARNLADAVDLLQNRRDDK